MWTVDDVMSARERGTEANFADLWRFLLKDGERVELATLNNARGPFTGRERPGRRFVASFGEALEAWKQAQALYRPDGSYIRMNPYDLLVEARPGTVPGLWHCPPYGLGVGAQDITRIDAVYQDIDPLPKRDSASEEQTRACIETGLALIEQYATVIPVEAMGIGPSGNGAMVLVATEPLMNTLDTARLLQMLARGAVRDHQSEHCKLDELTDPGRLIPACGVRKRRNGTGQTGTSPLKPTAFVCAPEVVRISRDQLVQLVAAFGAPITRVEHFSQIRPKSTAAVDAPKTWRDRCRALPIDRLYVAVATSPEGRRLGLSPDPNKPCCPRCIAIGGLGRRGRGVFLATLDSRWPSNKLRCRHDSCGQGQTRLNNLDIVTWVLCGHEAMTWTDEPVVKKWFFDRFGRDLDDATSPRSRQLRFT